MRFKIGEPFVDIDIEVGKIELFPLITGDKVIALFPGTFEDEPGAVSIELAPLLAGDYCDFLNDKYVDKEFNKEWPKVDVEKRIKYHEEQIKLLKSGKYSWNNHGNGVK